MFYCEETNLVKKKKKKMKQENELSPHICQ